MTVKIEHIVRKIIIIPTSEEDDRAQNINKHSDGTGQQHYTHYRKEGNKTTHNSEQEDGKRQEDRSKTQHRATEDKTTLNRKMSQEENNT